MKSIDMIAIEAIPDVFAGQRGHGPMVPLADHLLSYMIFPLPPVHMGIWRDVFIQDDDREIQAEAHFELRLF